jgi:hypothetical protein
MAGAILGNDGANRLGRHDRRRAGRVAPPGTKHPWEFEGSLRHATADSRTGVQMLGQLRSRYPRGPWSGRHGKDGTIAPVTVACFVAGSRRRSHSLLGCRRPRFAPLRPGAASCC